MYKYNTYTTPYYLQSSKRHIRRTTFRFMKPLSVFHPDRKIISLEFRLVVRLQGYDVRIYTTLLFEIKTRTGCITYVYNNSNTGCVLYYYIISAILISDRRCMSMRRLRRDGDMDVGAR